MKLKLLPVSLVAVISSSVLGQLEITEILFDTVDNEARWEWVEVRNSGTTDIDLNGGYYDDDDLIALSAPNIDSAMTPNTIIPPGQVAILFNGGNVTEAGFRSAWNLGANVRLIGVSLPYPALNNGGDIFGIWANTTDYQADLGDPDMNGQLEVVSFNNAIAKLNYSGFPDAGNGISSYWNGKAPYDEVDNWNTSDNDPAAVTSVMTTIATPINSTDDVGNPHVVTATGNGPATLLITEIMSNPVSTPESNWEWVEIYNNTDAAIDFSSTPYFFDDDDGPVLEMPNVATGTVAPGESAILFSDTITAQQFQDAWGAGNLIGVDFGNGLSNGGDTIGLWNDADAYTNDRANGGIPTGAEAYVPLADASWAIGSGDGMGSLSLIDMSDPTIDTHWRVSTIGDGSSFNSMQAFVETTDHVGGDLGSPGVGPGSPDGDFDNNGIYDCADINGLTAVIAAGTNIVSFDLTGDGMVDGADLTQWLAEAGSTGGLTTSGNPLLPADANLDGSVDAADFVIWITNRFSATTAWCSGNFNADDTVDAADFVIWNANRFTSADDLRTVPEPITNVVVMLIVTILMFHRRRGLN